MALSNQLIMNEGRAQYPYAVTAIGEAHRIKASPPQPIGTVSHHSQMVVNWGSQK